MGTCSRCGKKRFLLKWPRRLDVPELRAMVSHWPWRRVEVCPSCRPAHEEAFRERVRLLAPQVLAEGGDVTERVCLMCGRQDPDAVYADTARWVDTSLRPIATRFKVCGDCMGTILAGGVVSSAELQTPEDFKRVVARLPVVGDETVRQIEGWSPADGDRPPGATEVEPGLSAEAAANLASQFWNAAPRDVAAAEGDALRGAMILPEGANAVPTRLELQWKSGSAHADPAAWLRIYRYEATFTVVRGA